MPSFSRLCHTKINLFVFFIWATAINPISSKSETKLFQSKRIEMVVENELSKKIKQQIGFADSLFAIAYQSLNELEKNLVYKMSDQLHFILFNDLNKYKEYQQSHEIGKLLYPRTSINELIYFPIFLNGNYIDITYQLRYGAAQQFIQEFLNGLSLKDKINSDNSIKIPNWLINGFINYFAGGIQHEDFEYFQTQVKNGKFRNINYVSQEDSQLFGTAIWYLLEQEKGRDFNGAFWMLIKYANSFEKSFQYHFNIKFKEWMIQKLANIKQINKDIPENNDFKFKLPLKNCKYLKIQANNNSQSSNLKLFNNGFNNHYSEGENNFKITKNIGAPPSQTFNLPQTFIDKENNSFTIEYSKFNNWIITKNGKLFDSLGSIGQYQAFDIGIEEYAIVHQNLNYSEVLIKDKQDHTTIHSAKVLGSKISSILKLDSFQYAIGFENINSKSSRSHSSIDIIRFNVSGSLSKIRTLMNNSANQLYTKYSDFILEKPGQMGFIENTTSYRSYNICKFSDTGEFVFSLNTKGYFYGVSRNYNSSYYCEFFIDQENYYYNLIPTGIDVVYTDTFKQQEIKKKTYDTIKTTTVEKKIYKRSFTSAFEKHDLRLLPEMLDFQKESQKYIYKNFESWNFIKSSNYKFSNHEIDLPYSMQIPTTELYNSIATIFYNIDINQSLGRTSSNISLFSNANRRRLGLSASIYSNYNSIDWDATLNYRIRQFNDYNDRTCRNRSFRLKSVISKQYEKFNSLFSMIFDRNEIIQTNSSIEQLQFKNQSEYSIRAQLKINVNEKHKIRYHSNSNYDLNLFLSGGIFNDQYSSISPTFDLGLNTYFNLNWSLFSFKSQLNSVLSLSKRNQIWLIGGSNGWLSSSPYTDISTKSLKSSYKTFIQQGLFIRGLNSGTRAGTSFIGGQFEVHLNPFQKIPSLVLESRFWKSLSFYSFFDCGMGFVTLDPGHFDNPYNTVYINHPNYVLTASANRSPLIYSKGYGLNFEILKTTFRLEYAIPYEYNKKLKSALLLSLGKNF